MDDGQPPLKRPKVTLACDECRRRKSRCDGQRPQCSHCNSAGVSCNYRELIAVVEGEPTATAILQRVSAVESRVQTLTDKLELQLHSLYHRDNRAEIGAQEILVQEARPVDEDRYAGLPSFHHGASHMILQYWSRLRVRMTLPNVSVRQYMDEAEEEVIRLVQDQYFRTGASIGLSYDVRCAIWTDLPYMLLSLRDRVNELPLPLAILFNRGSEGRFDPGRFARRIRGTEVPPSMSSCSLEDLVVCSTLALMGRSSTSYEGMGGWEVVHPSKLEEFSLGCILCVLQQLWTLLSLPDGDLIELMLGLAAVLLYVFAWPRKALAMLSIAEPAIRRSLKESPDDAENTLRVQTSLFYLLQSDILSEFNGEPANDIAMTMSTQTDPLIPETLDFGDPTSPVQNQTTSPNSADGTHSIEAINCLSANLWLRSCRNNIMNMLYVPSQAYCPPHKTRNITTTIALDLQNWFQSLPLRLRFTRDVRTFKIFKRPISLRTRELAVRYHMCITQLYRPTVYYILYRDFEEISSLASPDQCSLVGSDIDLWILENCHACLESAALICLILGRENSGSDMSTTWIEIQALLGAYAVLLSAHLARNSCPELCDWMDLTEPLNIAEAVLGRCESLSLAYRKTLSIMKNIRYSTQSEDSLASSLNELHH